mgnify:CR=1 FL=1|jgi:hypothetical protein
MNRAVLLVFLALFSISSMACSPGNLYFQPVFSVDQEGLSAEEIKRLADWRADQRLRYPNGGEIYVDVQANAASGVSHELAERRLNTLRSLLQNFDIPQSAIEARVVDRKIDPLDLRSTELRPQVVRYINTATISIAPRCPHPCCPGPEPVHPN